MLKIEKNNYIAKETNEDKLEKLCKKQKVQIYEDDGIIYFKDKLCTISNFAISCGTFCHDCKLYKNNDKVQLETCSKTYDFYELNVIDKKILKNKGNKKC